MTTDPQDELFDVLDDEGRKTGVTKTRGAVHRDGDWHGAIHIWVGGVGAGGRPFVLLQRRSRTKDSWPGALDVAVGGHLRAGETLTEAVREAEEEIGLTLGVDDLTPLGRRRRRAPRDRGGIVDNEVQLAYAVRSDIPLDAYRLHPDEVDAVVAAPLEDAAALFEGRVESAAGLELARGSSAPAPIMFGLGDVAAAEVGGYGALALRGLGAVIAGARPDPFDLVSG